MSAPQFQFLPNAAPKDADVLILPVPLERTVCGRAGTAAGPRAILAASEQLEYYEEDQGWSPFEHLRVAVLEPFDMPITDGLEALQHQITSAASALPGIDGSKLFVGLGGEHAITPALVAARMQDPGTIVIFDAHADLRTTYQGSAFSHACAAHRLRELGHHIILLGVRSMTNDEAKRIADDLEITAFADRTLASHSGRSSALDILATLTGPVWLSLDMDVFDPTCVPGVGTPQPGGLGWHFVVDCLDRIILRSQAQIRGLDIVELIPESSQVSQVTAAKILQKTISFWGAQQGFQDKPKTGSQSGVEAE